MKQPPKQRPVKDERDEQIDMHSRSAALDFMIAAQLFYKYDKYEEKPYIQVGIGLGIIGVILFVWFGITG